MDQDHWKRCLEEAAVLYTRLREDPENETVKSELAQFGARGNLEGKALKHIEKVWLASGSTLQPKPKRGLSIAIAALLLGAGIFNFEPAYVFVFADVRSGDTAETTMLASGDVVTVDVRTSLFDNTTDALREVSVARGTALFDVRQKDRPFVVNIGDFRVEVTGTVFETATFSTHVSVTVLSGSVNVIDDLRTWRLEGSERLILSERLEPRLERVDTADAAAWRSNRLVANGMTVAEVVSALDQRIPGRIAIVGNALRDITISGNYDLEAPEAALELLASTVGARVIGSKPLLVLLSM
ncbi:MAG: FecR domain-containing protein [Pseudomonadota bacterium]